MIYTKDGYTPIKDIKVGDEVYSENVETGEKGLKRVKKVFVRETNVVVQLFFDDVEIRTTPEHPFWIPEKGWVPAGQLTVGDEVKFASDEQAKITSITQEILTQSITVYNFEVEEWHTYFVSQKEILVHNMCWRVGSRSVKNIAGDSTVVINGVTTKVHAGGHQPGIFKWKVDLYADAMKKNPKFFDKMDDQIVLRRLKNGDLKIVHGHHRFLASKLSETPLPINNPKAGYIDEFVLNDDPIRAWDYFTRWW